MRQVTLLASMESSCAKGEESEKWWYTISEKQSSGAAFVRALDR